MRIIAINGLKNCGKVELAEEWDKNFNVSFVKPYSDNMRPTDYILMHKNDLEFLIEHNLSLAHETVGNHHYLYDIEQMINDFNVVCVDDLMLKQLKENENIDLITVWVENPKAEPSERCGKLYKQSDYDYVYNKGLDDPGEFLEQMAFDLEMVQG